MYNVIISLLLSDMTLDGDYLRKLAHHFEIHSCHGGKQFACTDISHVMDAITVQADVVYCLYVLVKLHLPWYTP